MMERFDEWLVDWLDGRYYAARHPITARFWGRLATAAVDSFHRHYGRAPRVSNG